MRELTVDRIDALETRIENLEYKLEAVVAVMPGLEDEDFDMMRRIERQYREEDRTGRCVPLESIHLD